MPLRNLAVTAIGVDRPGIVTAVTEVLHERGANITDSSMTTLGGNAAIMLIAACRDEPETLEGALESATRDYGLSVHVSRAAEGRASPPPTHIVTVYGSDRPGLLHQAATALADRSVNITDLVTQLLEGERNVSACALAVTVPADLDMHALQAAVSAAVGDVEVHMRPADIETY